MELKLLFYCALLFCLNTVDSIPWDIENIPRYPEVYNNEPTTHQFPARKQYQNWNQQLTNNDRLYPSWQYPNNVNKNNGLVQNWPEYRYIPNGPAQSEGLNSNYPVVPENQNSGTNTPFVQNGWQNINQRPAQNQPVKNGFATITDQQYFNQQGSLHNRQNQWSSNYDNFYNKPQEIVEDNQKPNKNNVNFNQFYPPIPIVPNKPLDATHTKPIIIDEPSSSGAQRLLDSNLEASVAPRISVDAGEGFLASASNPVETVSGAPGIPEEPIKNQIKKLISDPKIRGYLSSGIRKRYMIVHPNGTIEHVNTLNSITQDRPNYVLVHAGDLVTKPNKQTTDEENAQQTLSASGSLVQSATAFSRTSIDVDPMPMPVDNLQNASENVGSAPYNSTEEVISTIPDTKIPVNELKGDNEIKENVLIASTFTDWPLNITLTPTNNNSSPIEIPPGGKVFVSVNSSQLDSLETAPEIEIQQLTPIFNDTISEDNMIFKNETRDGPQSKVFGNPSSGDILSVVSDVTASEPQVQEGAYVKAAASTNPSTSRFDGIPNVGDLDISKVKTNANPLVFFNSTEQDFWKKLSNSDKGFDVVYFFQIQSPPKVDNETTRTIYPNGTIVEEVTTTVWSPEQDKPTITKTTKIIKPEENPVT